MQVSLENLVVAAVVIYEEDNSISNFFKKY